MQAALRERNNPECDPLGFIRECNGAPLSGMRLGIFSWPAFMLPNHQPEQFPSEK